MIAGQAWAQDSAGRDYCPARPGLDDTPCTILPGRVSVETGLATWQRDTSGGARVDTATFAETFVRFGLTDSLEAGVDWTPYGHVRTRPDSGPVWTQGGTGDVTVTLKQNLTHPDGNGFSVALEPYVQLPAGGEMIGAGDWGAGAMVPLSFDFGGGIGLQATSQVAAAVDADRRGRHLALSQVGGVAVDLSKAVSATAELQVIRDEDPERSTTQAYAALSLAWSPSDNLQLDAGATAGLNRDSSDFRLSFGISRRF